MSGPPQPKLKDFDLMLWGKHKGKRMDELSNSYMLWLFHQPWLEEEYPAVLEYILNAMPALREKKDE